MMSASSLLTTLVTVMSVFERITSPFTPCSATNALTVERFSLLSLISSTVISPVVSALSSLTLRRSTSSVTCTAASAIVSWSDGISSIAIKLSKESTTLFKVINPPEKPFAVSAWERETGSVIVIKAALKSTPSAPSSAGVKLCIASTLSKVSVTISRVTSPVV